MDCIEFSRDLLPDLTRLLNAQLAGIPPGWTLTDTQVANTIASASSLWSQHYPDQKAAYTLETLCVLDQGNLIAAAQWGKPVLKEILGIDSSSVLFWIAGRPDSEQAMLLLLQILETKARAAGCPSISMARYSFGVGWLGIPAHWSQVTAALQASGFALSDRWAILTGSTTDYPPPGEPGSLESLETAWQVDAQASEWDLRLQTGGSLVGECSAWGIPLQFSGCDGYSNWITIEWLGVEPAYQRKGFGRWLLAGQLHRQAQRGIPNAMFWTGPDNQPMLTLGRSLGFQIGPECWVFEKTL